MDLKYRNSVAAISHDIKLWIPKPDVHAQGMHGGRTRSRIKGSLRRLAGIILTKPSAPPPIPDDRHGMVYESSHRISSCRSFEDSQGGLSKNAQFAMDRSAFDEWRDREANPDDYEPEVSTCGTCGEAIAFYLTGFGTITEWCPECGIISEGATFQPVRRPTAGAFGERNFLAQTRRFWSVGQVPKRPRTYWPKTGPASRIFLAPEAIPSVIGGVIALNPSYANRTSAYAHIIRAACAGKPIVVPTPMGVSQTVFANRLRCVLHMNKRTRMAKWSVSPLPNDGGLRVGVVGSWLIK